MKDVCKYCGTSFNEILENGFVGCSHCYDEIEPLKETISKMYEGKKHRGRTSRRYYG